MKLTNLVVTSDNITIEALEFNTELDAEAFRELIRILSDVHKAMMTQSGYPSQLLDTTQQ